MGRRVVGGRWCRGGGGRVHVWGRKGVCYEGVEAKLDYTETIQGRGLGRGGAGVRQGATRGRQGYIAAPGRSKRFNIRDAALRNNCLSQVGSGRANTGNYGGIVAPHIKHSTPRGSHTGAANQRRPCYSNGELIG